MQSHGEAETLAAVTVVQRHNNLTHTALPNSKSIRCKNKKKNIHLMDAVVSDGGRNLRGS